MSGTIFVTVARILEVHGLKLSGTVPQIMIALLQDFNSSMADGATTLTARHFPTEPEQEPIRH